MPGSDALVVSGALAAMGLAAVAAGIVGGLLCSIRQSNRTSAVRRSELSADGRAEDAFGTTPSSAPGGGATETAVS